jgi:hypothetical protein
VPGVRCQVPAAGARAGRYEKLSAFRILLTAYCLLPTAYCLLLTAYCLLPTAYCLLPTAYCLLLTAYCLLPTAYCPYATVCASPPGRRNHDAVEKPPAIKIGGLESEPCATFSCGGARPEAEGSPAT